jgi:hypothetical protein
MGELLNCAVSDSPAFPFARTRYSAARTSRQAGTPVLLNRNADAKTQTLYSIQATQEFDEKSIHLLRAFLLGPMANPWKNNLPD